MARVSHYTFNKLDLAYLTVLFYQNIQN